MSDGGRKLDHPPTLADEHEPPTGSSDPYERQYMDGDRAVLRARQRQPRWVPASVLAGMLLMLVGIWPMLAWIWAHRDVPGALLALLMWGSLIVIYDVVVLFALLTGHLTRVVLTPSHLHVHCGLDTDEIALDRITAVSVESARWWRPPHSLRGALLRCERSYLTGAECALRVEWRDKKGRDKKTWIQFEAAGEFASGIEVLTATTTGVRMSQMPSGRDEGDESGRPGQANLTRSAVLRGGRDDE